jgi:hypothetical protein
VGYYFKDILTKVAKENKIQIDKVVQSPMEGLLNYHKDLQTEI